VPFGPGGSCVCHGVVDPLELCEGREPCEGPCREIKVGVKPPSNQWRIEGKCTEVSAISGGLVELSVDSSGSPARVSEGGGAASFPFAAIAGTAAAAAAAALAAGGWYARRRFSKG